MKIIKGLQFGMIAAAAMAVALIGGLMLAGSAAAQGGATLTVSDGSAQPGDEGDVSLDVGAVGEPGLGAWTVDVTYDVTVITAVDCTAEHGGVCNEAFDLSTVRIAGATAEGLVGEATLGGITFVCLEGPRSSDLTVTTSVFSDATVGDPQPIDVTLVHGTFECGDGSILISDGDIFGVDDLGDLGWGLTESGGGGGFGWLIAMLAVAGVAGLAVGFGLLRPVLQPNVDDFGTLGDFGALQIDAKGSDGGSFGWLIGVLAVAGAAGVVVGLGALRRR